MNICGLGQFAKQAAEAGYKNASGTVNLMMANDVIRKFAKLVPKSQLSKADLEELNAASKALSNRLHLPTDTYSKK